MSSYLGSMTVTAMIWILLFGCSSNDNDNGTEDSNSEADSNIVGDTDADTDTDTDTDTESSKEWNSFWGSSWMDRGYSVSKDKDGNLYITGYSAAWNGPAGESPLHANSGADDILVLKLSPQGEYQWHTFFGSEGNDEGFAAATDNRGNLYITGYSEAAWNGSAGEIPLHAHSGTDDIVVLKINSEGEYQWHTFFGSSANTGVSGGVSTNAEAPGEFLATTPPNMDIGYSIAAADNENLYVTGYSAAAWNGPVDESPLHKHSEADNMFVLRIDSKGKYQWHTFYGGSGCAKGYSTAVDQAGNVYAAVNSSGEWLGPDDEAPLHEFTNAYEMSILKLDAEGTYQWHTFYNAPPIGLGISSFSLRYAIVLDTNDNLYAAGISGSPWNGPAGEAPLHESSIGSAGLSGDIFLLKLDASSGSYQWHTFINCSSNIGALAMGGDESLYIVGSSQYAWDGPSGEAPLHAYQGEQDIFIVKLDISGEYHWHTFYGSDDPYDDYGCSLIADDQGRLIATGVSAFEWNGPAETAPFHAHSGSGQDDIFVLKLKDPEVD